MDIIFEIWRDSLRSVLYVYETKRSKLTFFFPKLFMFFILLNISCYWWAMFTAFPSYMHGSSGYHYFKMQFPVGLLGALFDSLSFFVTVFIIRRALRSQNSAEYVAHLSLDIVIAVLATFWVLFVFSFSGWLVSLIEAKPELLAVRNRQYENMLSEAVINPAGNVRNIYFGLIMGVSASLPTCLHIYLFFRSCMRKRTDRNEQASS